MLYINHLFFFVIKAVYQLFWIFFSPFVLLFLKKRVQRNLEDPKRLQERFSKATYPPNMHAFESVVWFHAASVGEVLSLKPFLLSFKKNFPADFILLTTVTKSAADIAERHYHDLVYHQYIPLDHPLWISRFLKQWKPRLTFVVESELWPNMLLKLQRHCIPTILLNARLSNRSFQRWKKLRFITPFLFKTFHRCFAQNQETVNRLHHLGVLHAEIMPNLKFLCDVMPLDSIAHEKITTVKGQSLCLSFISSHDPEEDMIFKIYRKLCCEFSNVLLILAPRHPQRIESILKACQSYGFSATLYSSLIQDPSKKQLLKPPSVILVDQLGVLGTIFSFSDLVVMGGSFINHGGHNPIEPAFFRRPTLCGPHMFNFNDIMALFQKNQKIQVQDADELYKWVQEFLRSKAKREALGTTLFSIADHEKKKGEAFLNNFFKAMK